MRTRNLALPITTGVETTKTETRDTAGVYSTLYSHTWPGLNINNGISRLIVDEQPKYDRYGTVQHDVKALTLNVVKFDRIVFPFGRFYTSSGYAEANRVFALPSVTNALAATIVVTTTNWQKMSGEAVRSMLPSFNDDNSLVNFVLELKDLKRIPDLWRPKRNKLLGKVPPSWRKPKRGKEASLISDLVQSAKRKGTDALTRGARKSAQLQLTYAFGIMPLISDITTMVDSLAKFRKKLRDLIDRMGKPITRHYGAALPYTELVERTAVYREGALYQISPGKFVWPYEVQEYREWEERPTYHASMRFTYSLPDMSSIDNQLKAFLDTLGVRPNLAILWNAARLSFLVDWLVNVGDFLDSLSVDNLQIPVVIEDFCHSTKYSFRQRFSCSHYGSEEYAVGERVTSQYLRVREIPHTYNKTIKSTGVNMREARLGGALFVANWKPRWSKRAGRWLRS